MLKPTRILRAAESWSKTLNLPRSALPPRPLPQHRPAYLKQCTDDLYAWQAAHRKNNESFVLHDGPPYANGHLHIGHALNKILKDVFCRSQLALGKRVEYVPGWDCHGMPIELKALQESQDYKSLSPRDIRTKARALAARTINKQKQSFKEWGVMGDWDNSYQTMEKDYEIRQLRVFKDMVEKGLIYRQNKPVYWSPSSGTALAEAELEYDPAYVSTSAFVKMRVVVFPPALKALDVDIPVYLLVWTTTPWTLPANKAIAIKADLEYSVLQTKGATELIIVASSRVDEAIRVADAELGDLSIGIHGIKGHLLAQGMQYINMLQGKRLIAQPVVAADFVSADSGTGLVHMAPGHGAEDFDACRVLDIPAFAPVDDKGRFTNEAFADEPSRLEGKFVLDDGNEAVIDMLKEKNMLWAVQSYEHKYPIDWRTKLPVIVRATPQWFADVGSVKDAASKSLNKVEFKPSSGKSRLQSFVSSRSQWCISRQRAWGVPIPALYGTRSGNPVMTPEFIEHIINVIQERGIDAWWTDPEDSPAWIPEGLAGSYRRGKDTMDVWFDSGTSWTQLTERLKKPLADMYVEGTDQHRGWFQSSLLTSIACQSTNTQSNSPMTTGGKTGPQMLTAPFGTLVTHGFTLDHMGRKMSKSIGNVVSPDEIINGTLLPQVKPRKGQASKEPVHDAMGPDALRLWVASSDYTGDVMIGEPVLRSIHQTLHKYRVTLKWLLGVLHDFVPVHPQLPSTRFVDRLALYQLHKATLDIQIAYREYEPYKAVNLINRYINHDLSSFYFESVKDTLYTATATERLAAQSTCFEILTTLLAMLSPITPLLVAETLDYATPFQLSHLHFTRRDPFKDTWKLPEIESKHAHRLEFYLQCLNSAQIAIRRCQEASREQKLMRSGLECRVKLTLVHDESSSDERLMDDDTAISFFGSSVTPSDLESIFVVSGIEVDGSNESTVIDAEEAKQISEYAGVGQVQQSQIGDDWCFEALFAVPQSPLSELSGNQAPVLWKAQVMPPANSKCPRCWRYVVEEQNDDICGRCKVAVQENAISTS